jgi:hippurate hydrolase
MDALPIHERSGLPYASVHDGKMHACGHDGHTAVLLGAARQLARHFNGTVHLIFQPAEEIGAGGGAERMLADGLFERFPCDAIFGLHNHPGAEAGTFMFRSGPFMAACDTVAITIRGKGGHARGRISRSIRSWWPAAWSWRCSPSWRATSIRTRPPW